MARISSHKRQREMKRQEKAKLKAERRAEKKEGAKNTPAQVEISRDDSFDNLPPLAATTDHND
jgi:hypothetical protein